MRILIGWDDPSEAELITLYLNASEENEAVAVTEPAEFLAQADSGQVWDVILMATDLSDTDRPDIDGAFEIFQQVRQFQPECPVVSACQTEDVYRIARFITHGLRSYVLRDLGGDFVFLLQSTLESIVQAVRAEREQRIAERMREEIESVRMFQESILPHELRAPSGYDISACYEPSQIREWGGQPVILAGGDYYDVIQLDERTLVLLVGDASGHGMRACMSIMTMQILMRMLHSKLYRKTSTFVAQVNQQFCEQSVSQRDGSLITLLYGVLNVDKHQFQWTSAGHPAPVLHDRSRGTIEPIALTQFGVPLGVDGNVKYQTHKMTLPPGSRLLLYSDGLVEAFPKGEQSHQYGIEGVMKTMARTGHLSVDATLQSLLDDSHAFTQDAGRHDDTSAVLLERR